MDSSIQDQQPNERNIVKEESETGNFANNAGNDFTMN